MNSHSNFLDKEQAEIRAWQRKLRGMVSDALKSHEQMVAEELLEIQAERVAKQAELETLERLARASQQGREKAANEFSASNRHAAAPESPPAIDIGERERKSRTNTPPFHTVALHQLVERQRRIQLAGLEERERIRVREEHEADKAKAQDAAPVVPDSASHAPEMSPPPVATRRIAVAFAGLRGWDEKAWKDNLGSPPKWLEACIALRGQRGIREHHWNPVLIGGALVRDGHAKPNNIRARFQTKRQLEDWKEAWKTYEADNFDTQ